MRPTWLAATLMSTPLLLPACLIEHGLGQTAEGGSGGGSGEGGTTNVDPDPSATGGSPPDGSSGSDETTGVPTTTNPTSTEDGTDTSTDTGQPTCEPGLGGLQWAETFPEPLPGINASFAAVLAGECTLVGTSSTDQGPVHEWEMQLSCLLSGRLDGDASVVDQPFMPVISGTSPEPLDDWLFPTPAPQQAYQLRVVLDHWGMGWNRYLLLGNNSYNVLDMVSAEYPDPLLGDRWLEDIEAMLGGQPWHGDLVVETYESSCDLELGPCGEVIQSLRIGWTDTTLEWLDPGEGDLLPESPAGVYHHATVTQAADISKPMCRDTPLGDYRFAVHSHHVLAAARP